MLSDLRRWLKALHAVIVTAYVVEDFVIIPGPRDVTWEARHPMHADVLELKGKSSSPVRDEGEGYLA
jgi:hypothetical protein